MALELKHIIIKFAAHIKSLNLQSLVTNLLHVKLNQIKIVKMPTFLIKKKIITFFLQQIEDKLFSFDHQDYTNIFPLTDLDSDTFIYKLLYSSLNHGKYLINYKNPAHEILSFSNDCTFKHMFFFLEIL